MSNFNFEPIMLDDFPELVTEEFFGRQRPDDFLFCEVFIERLEQKLKSEIEQVQLFNGGASRASFAFVYADDLNIRGLEFSADLNLSSWFTAMAESFGKTTTHRITSSGMDGMAFSGWEELAADPAAVAKKHAPKSHFKAKLKNEKADYFRYDSIKTTSSSDARFGSLFEAIIKSHATPPNVAGIDALERQVGTPLPQDFRALYTATDGIPGVFHGFDLLSVENAAAQLASWTQIYNEWSLEDLRSQQSAEKGIHPVYCTPRWIPFVDLVGGNFLAIDLAPAKRGTYGQVIVFGRDIDTKRLIAKSLAEFLQQVSSYDGSKKHALYSVFGELKY